MSLANRLAAVIPLRSNRGGCVTCQWVNKLSDADRRAWDEWITEGRSLSQLWEVAAANDENPFPVSLTALRHHVRNHKAADES